MPGGSNTNRDAGKSGGNKGNKGSSKGSGKSDSGEYRFLREKSALDKLRVGREKDAPFPLSPDEEDSLKGGK